MGSVRLQNPIGTATSGQSPIYTAASEVVRYPAATSAFGGTWGESTAPSGALIAVLLTEPVLDPVGEIAIQRLSRAADAANAVESAQSDELAAEARAALRRLCESSGVDVTAWADGLAQDIADSDD